MGQAKKPRKQIKGTSPRHGRKTKHQPKINPTLQSSQQEVFQQPSRTYTTVAFNVLADYSHLRWSADCPDAVIVVISKQKTQFMPCRVGITTDPATRKAYWKDKLSDSEIGPTLMWAQNQWLRQKRIVERTTAIHLAIVVLVMAMQAAATQTMVTGTSMNSITIELDRHYWSLSLRKCASFRNLRQS